jgi:hypothetical protein
MLDYGFWIMALPRQTQDEAVVRSSGIENQTCSEIWFLP